MEFKFLADHEEAIPIIAEWYFNEWGYLHEERSAAKTSLRLQKYLNKNKIPLIVLAVDNDEIMGAAQLKYREMDIYPDKKHWIGGIYVPQKYCGNGIATRLIENVLEVARSFDVNILYLQTERLDGGQYKRLGWEAVEQVTHKGIEVFVMKSILANPRLPPGLRILLQLQEENFAKPTYILRLHSSCLLIAPSFNYALLRSSG